MATFLLLKCVDDGYMDGRNDVGYWNFIPVTAHRETPLPKGILIDGADQGDAMRRYKAIVAEQRAGQ